MIPTFRSLPRLLPLALLSLTACAGQVNTATVPPTNATISTEARIITSPRSLEAIVATLAPAERAAFTPRDGAILLNPHSLELLLRAVQADTGSSNICAPRITTFENDPAEIALTTKTPYTRSFQPAADGQWTPDTQSIEHGVRFSTFARLAADHAAVQGTYKLSIVTLGGFQKVALATLTDSAGRTYTADVLHDAAHHPLVIDIPETRAIDIQTTVTIPADHTILLVGQKIPGELEILNVAGLERLQEKRAVIKQDQFLLFLVRPQINHPETVAVQ